MSNDEYYIFMGNNEKSIIVGQILEENFSSYNSLSLIFKSMYSMSDSPEELRAKFEKMGVLLLLDNPA